MADLILRVRLFEDDDKPLVHHAVTVEMFDLCSGAWRALDGARSDDRGVIDARFDLAHLSSDKLGPALRLAGPGPPARVLPPGPMPSVTGRARDLLADFGEVERLGETGFDRLDSGGAKRDTVAELARKAGVPQTSILRNVALNPQLGMVIGGTAARPAPVEAARDPGIAAEFGSMRAICIDAAAKLADKDRIIATRELELILKTTALSDALARATAAEDRLKAATPATAVKTADDEAVFTNIGTKLGDTQAALKTAKTPFRVVNIRADLKGTLDDSGKIVLGRPDPDGSGVSADMAPDTGARGDR